METVEPIKSIEQIKQMKIILRKSSMRDHLLFVFGINTGIRIHHLLHLKVKDICKNGEIKEYIDLFETTSEKKQSYFINPILNATLESYLETTAYSDKDYLFSTKNGEQPISRQQAYRIIHRAAEEAGITEKVGMHTLRKTFGYHAYHKGIAISLLQQIYGHTTPGETLRYIGVNKNQRLSIKVDVNL